VKVDFAGWIDAAESRLAAIGALETLSQTQSED